MPIQALHTGTLQAIAPQQHSISKKAQPAPEKEHGIDTLDSFVHSGSLITERFSEAHINYKNARNATQINSKNMLGFKSVKQSVKRAMLWRAVTSGARNGYALYKGKITAAEAGGNFVADMGSAAVSGSVGAVASNLTIKALSKTSLGYAPIVIGGTVAGWAASWGTGQALKAVGAHGFVAEGVTNLISKDAS